MERKWVKECVSENQHSNSRNITGWMLWYKIITRKWRRIFLFCYYITKSCYYSQYTGCVCSLRGRLLFYLLVRTDKTRSHHTKPNIPSLRRTNLMGKINIQWIIHCDIKHSFFCLIIKAKSPLNKLWEKSRVFTLSPNVD